MLMRLRLFCGAIFLAGPILSAQVAQVREYTLHTPRDKGILFAMAVTPEQDVLSFVARPDGKWLLTRVRSWLDKTPSEKTIDVPGWTRADLATAFGPVLLDLFVTPDGHFVICVASAKWNRNQKLSWDSLISVVDLQRFEVVTTPTRPRSERNPIFFSGWCTAPPVRDKSALLIAGRAVVIGCRRRCRRKEPRNREHKPRHLNGRTYQLVIEGGTKLKVYELKGDALR